MLRKKNGTPILLCAELIVLCSSKEAEALDTVAMSSWERRLHRAKCAPSCKLSLPAAHAGNGTWEGTAWDPLSMLGVSSRLAQLGLQSLSVSCSHP